MTIFQECPKCKEREKKDALIEAMYKELTKPIGKKKIKLYRYTYNECEPCDVTTIHVSQTDWSSRQLNNQALGTILKIEEKEIEVDE